VGFTTSCGLGLAFDNSARERERAQFSTNRYLSLYLFSFPIFYNFLYIVRQVTTVTQMVREVQHIGPDGQPVVIDPYNPYGEYAPQTGTYGRNGSASSLGVGVGQQPQRFANYEHIAEGADYRTHSPAATAYGRTVAPANYADYEPYPQLAGGARGGVGGQILVGPPPDYAYQTAQPPGLYRDYPDMMDPANAGALPMYGERPPTPISPSEQSESPLPHHSRGNFVFVYIFFLFFLFSLMVLARSISFFFLSDTTN